MAKILVIEDEAELRTNVARLLKAEGFEVLTAENGAVGVDTAVALLPDLIICDISMPEMDGFGVLFSLRENVTTSHIPFIFLTASTRTYDRNFGVELGANDYITKPFKLQDLLEAV
ncbi:MAG TPA: response regulator, partial [Burkholderiales bacterium]|nr:response regulator [Burkholderiales bacterium]